MNYKEQIASLEQEIKEARLESDLEYQKIGKEVLGREGFKEDLASLGLADALVSEIVALVERGEELESAADLHRTTINETRRSIEKLRAINSEIAELELSIKTIEEQNRGLYEPIGELAFNAYLNNPGRFSAYAEAFKEILSLHERLMLLDQKEAEAENSRASSSPLQNFIRKGIAVADQIKRSGAQKRLRSELARLGQLVLEGDFIESAKNPELLEAATPALKNLEKIQSLDNSLAERKLDLEGVNSFLAAIRKETNAANPEKAIHILEHKIEISGQNLGETQVALGKLAASSEAFGNDGGILPFIQTLAEIEERIRTLKVDLAENRAAIEYLEAEKRISQLDRDSAAIGRIIAQKEADLENLERERKKQLGLKEDAAKRAGSKLEKS